MDTRQLRYFIEMADRLNFRETAEALYVSQSALSRQISELENELGGKLFKRSTRSVTLTELGRICRSKAQRMIDESEGMLDAARLKETGNNLIRIGCHQSGRPYAVYEISRRFMKVHKNIDVRVTIEDTDTLWHMFERNELDIVMMLRSGIRDRKGLDIVRIENGQLYAVLRKDDTLAEKEKIDISSLKSRKILVKNQATLNVMNGIIESGGLKNIEAGENENNNISNLVKVALGQGILLVPVLGTETMISDSHTVCLPVVSPGMDSLDEVAVKKSANRDPSFRWMLDVIKEYREDRRS